jgi:U3 small nucleolar RNA-associated protein 10
MEGFFHLLRVTLRHADKQNLPTMVKPIFAFFLDVFDLRHRLQKRNFDQVVSLLSRIHRLADIQVINEIEESAITSFLELVVRLNEVTFKPLFIRLYDWAVIDLSEGASKSTIPRNLGVTDIQVWTMLVLLSESWCCCTS